MTDADRAEVVTRLAMYDTVKSIQEDLLERGIDISHQAISAYNPEVRHGGRTVSKKWADLFYATREKWLSEIAAEPISHRSYRLRRLGVIHDRAMTSGDLGRAQSALKQAADEMTALIGVTVPLMPTVPERTEDESRNMLLDRIADRLAKRAHDEMTGSTTH